MVLCGSVNQAKSMLLPAKSYARYYVYNIAALSLKMSVIVIETMPLLVTYAF